ncbi:hypothetical protein CDAR_482631, partial [Caerostris darwini]
MNLQPMHSSWKQRIEATNHADPVSSLARPICLQAGRKIHGSNSAPITR